MVQLRPSSCRAVDDMLMLKMLRFPRSPGYWDDSGVKTQLCTDCQKLSLDLYAFTYQFGMTYRSAEPVSISKLTV